MAIRAIGASSKLVKRTMTHTVTVVEYWAVKIGQKPEYVDKDGALKFTLTSATEPVQQGAFADVPDAEAALAMELASRE